MKRLTATQLAKILAAAYTVALGAEDSERDIAELQSTVKIGSDAVGHTGQTGISAYFATESTMISSAQYDFPSVVWAFEETLQKGLEPFGMFAEPINGCEYGIYVS